LFKLRGADASLLLMPLDAALVVAARGGLSGGDGTPELTSGIPLRPAGPGRGVVEALEYHRSGIDGVARRVDGGAMGVEVVHGVVITTTTG